MAYEKMKKSDKWYSDNHVNAVVAHMRENSKDPNVIILDTVVADGAKYSKGDVRNLEMSLTKYSRLKPNVWLAAAHAFIVLHEIHESITPKDVADFVRDDNSVKALTEKEKGALADFFNFPEGDNPSVTTKELKKKLEEKITVEVGNDPFDEIKKLSDKGNFTARILFPYNIENRHWVLGEIEIVKDKSGVTFFPPVYDSMGERKFTDADIALIERIISDRLGVKAEQGLIVAGCKPKVTQADGSSCGPITLENLRLRALGKPVLSERVPAGAQELRNQQYKMATDKMATATFEKKNAADPNGRWDAHHSKTEVLEAFNEIFITENEVQDVKLVDHTVQTNVLTKENLEAFVKSTKELMDKLNLKGEVEVNAPADKKGLLIELCKKHGLKLAAETKAAPAKVEPERMDTTEKAMSRSRGLASAPA